MRPRLLLLAPLCAAALSAVAALPGAGLAQPSSAPRAIDPAKSSARFCIPHVFVTRVCGTVPIVEGSVVLAPGSAIPTRATAVLDPSRINTGDRDRDGSLESPDYFDVKQYPTWTFTSTKIAPTGPAAFEMDGTLTMHGVTQPERLEVTIRGDAEHSTYHAVGHIDRRTWGMKGTRLDPVIGTTADVTLDVALK